MFCGFRYSFAHVNSGKTAGKNRNCVIKPKYNMSPFVIFVIVLTIIYIIYYAVMITRDLYGKKEDHKTQEEVFDVSDMVEEEAAVSVHESDNGLAWQIRSTRRLTSMMKTRHLHQQMAKVETQSLKNNHPRTSLRIWLTSLKRRVMRFSPP